MFNSVETCKLIRTSKHKDAIGQLVACETSRTVYCQSSDVSRSEWLAAGQAGLAADLRLTVNAHSYNGEEICEYRGQRYGIYRTYLTDRQQIELYLERKAGV